MFIQGYVPFALIQDNTGLIMVESTVLLAEACVVASLKLTFSLTHMTSVLALQVFCIPISHLHTNLHLKVHFPENSKEDSAHLEM